MCKTLVKSIKALSSYCGYTHTHFFAIPRKRFSLANPTKTLSLKLRAELVDSHVLVLAGLAVVVQETVGVGALHHLHQDGSEFSLQCQQPLGERSRGHLDSTLVRRIDFQIMAEC